MIFLNRLLTKALILALIANGCLALALIDEQHQIRESQQAIAGAVPTAMLKPLPVTPARAQPVAYPVRKPVIKNRA